MVLQHSRYLSNSLMVSSHSDQSSRDMIRSVLHVYTVQLSAHAM